MGIESSDYIFSVKGDDSTEPNMIKLVETLQNHGFQTQARPGAGSSVLVFARASAKTYDQIVSDDLHKMQKFGVTSKDDAPADRPMLIYAYLTSPKGSSEYEGVGLTPGKGEWKFIDSVMPNSAFLADKSVAQLGQKQVQAASLLTASILKSYGSQVALYFEFLKFYITSLGFLSIFGVVAYVKSKNYSLTYAFLNVIWGISFLLLWKNKERALVNLWGVQNARKVDKQDASLASHSAAQNTSNPRDKRTGNKAGYRFLKEWAFVPIALVFMAVLVTYQLSCFALEIFLSEIYDGPGKTFLTLVPTVLISVFVPVLTIIYNLVVDKFLSWEGHDNNYTRYDSFVVKTFTLNFLTGYVPLLITSFIYLPFAHLIEPELPVIKSMMAANIDHDRYAYKYLSKIKSQRKFTINQARLDGQFFYFIVTNQVILFVLRYVLPVVLPPVIKFVRTQILGKKDDVLPVDKPEEKEWLSSVRRYAQLPEHNVHDDYRGLCMQFGYLAMFGPVWTLAPLLCAVFNVMTFKMDLFKLSSGKYFRPPVPKRTDTIHPWDFAFFALAWLGSVISPAVTAFYRHGTKPPKPLGQFAMDKASVNVSSSTRFWLTLFASEHMFFVLFFLGSKISSFMRSDKEIENTQLSFGRGSEKSQSRSSTPLISGNTSGDWESFSIEDIKKQAKGTGKVVSPESSGKNAALEKKKFASESGALSGVSRTVQSPAVEQGLVNRTSKVNHMETEKAKAERLEELKLEKERLERLRELEEKKAQLERVKDTLQKRQLEARKETGDSVIETIDAQGKKTPAIIDNDQHISMSDVEDIERKLSANKKKNAAGGIVKNAAGGIGKNSERQLEEYSESGYEKDSMLRSSAGPNKSDSLEERSTSSKLSRKKSLKRILRRG